MRNFDWVAHLSANGLFPGLDLHFLENPEIVGAPPLAWGAGQLVRMEKMGGSGAGAAEVTLVAPGQICLAFEGQDWQLTPPTSADFINPPRTSMRVHTWVVRGPCPQAHRLENARD